MPDGIPAHSHGQRHHGLLEIPVPTVTDWFQLRLLVRPIPKGRPRARVKQIVVKGRKIYTGEVYTPAYSGYYEAQIRLLALLSNIWHMPEGAVGILLFFCFKRPDRLQKKSSPEGYLWRPQNPDTDNLEKAVWDALNGVAWTDDAQVTFSQMYDVFAPKDGADFIDICMFSLGAECLELEHRSTLIEDTLDRLHRAQRELKRLEKKRAAEKIKVDKRQAI
jgi:Holliday junction resolvase RusA-like endonuclease